MTRADEQGRSRFRQQLAAMGRQCAEQIWKQVGNRVKSLAERQVYAHIWVVDAHAHNLIFEQVKEDNDGSSST